jgi:hypothetical protein
MKLPVWFPRPASWATGLALFAYAYVVRVGMLLALPWIVELMRLSQRLGWLAFLLLWVAPIALAAAIHRVGHHALDALDDRGAAPRVRTPAGHLWAGYVAWASVLLVSTLTSLVMLVIDPPPAEDDAVSMLLADMAHGTLGVVRAGVWIVLAACVYEVERAAGGGAKK